MPNEAGSAMLTPREVAHAFGLGLGWLCANGPAYHVGHDQRCNRLTAAITARDAEHGAALEAQNKATASFSRRATPCASCAVYSSELAARDVTITRLEAENVVLRADRDVAVSVAWNLRRGSRLEAERDRLKGALERVAVEVTCESFGRIKCVRCFVFDGAHDPMCPTLIAARALATPGEPR